MIFFDEQEFAEKLGDIETPKTYPVYGTKTADHWPTSQEMTDQLPPFVSDMVRSMADDTGIDHFAVIRVEVCDAFHIVTIEDIARSYGSTDDAQEIFLWAGGRFGNEAIWINTASFYGREMFESQKEMLKPRPGQKLHGVGGMGIYTWGDGIPDSEKEGIIWVVYQFNYKHILAIRVEITNQG